MKTSAGWFQCARRPNAKQRRTLLFEARYYRSTLVKVNQKGSMDDPAAL
jgi:hypothetical protein